MSISMIRSSAMSLKGFVQYFQEYTKLGRKKKASYQMIGEWVSEGFKFLRDEHHDTVVKSFSKNGLTKNDDLVLQTRLTKKFYAKDSA